MRKRVVWSSNWADPSTSPATVPQRYTSYTRPIASAAVSPLRCRTRLSASVEPTQGVLVKPGHAIKRHFVRQVVGRLHLDGHSGSAQPFGNFPGIVNDLIASARYQYDAPHAIASVLQRFEPEPPQ